MIKNVLCFLITAFSFGQVGINNNSPEANLDIKQLNNENNKAFILKNSNLETISEIDYDGSLFFRRGLRSNENFGTDKQILVSQGDNKYPIWTNIENTKINIYNKHYIKTVFFGYNINSSSYTNGDHYLSFSESDVLIRTTFNTGNGNLEYITRSQNPEVYPSYKVNKKGIYDIILTAIISPNNPNSELYAEVNLGGFIQFAQDNRETNELASNKKYITYTSTCALEENDDIYFKISSNSDWRFDNLYVIINYTEINP